MKLLVTFLLVIEILLIEERSTQNQIDSEAKPEGKVKYHMDKNLNLDMIIRLFKQVQRNTNG